MIEIKGKYNTAIVYTDRVEPSAEVQIRAFCDQEFLSNSKIRIMPDVHAGAGCTIGTTMTIADKAVPNFVGVDIGQVEVEGDLWSRRLSSDVHQAIDAYGVGRERVADAEVG